MLNVTAKSFSKEKIAMRKPAEWMTNSADDRILEFLADNKTEEPVGVAPTEIADAVGYGRQHIGRRCRALADQGLLLNLGRGSYRITELGEGYLSGDVDPDELDSEEG
jgi:predicted transcriptional regulator